ncbi:hypothetical protein [Cytophaga aurantiaca]|uniref:hypothetical protein n=1 Tax=Cytophaga aurantiaca TaxID=29530 RepID=UPI0003783DA2|nr:hypothetical protein [Cytophaga aurantiaca]
MQIKPIKERSPFVLFLPFLFIYILYVIRFHTDQMAGDEARYIQFAQNLLHGFYSPAYPNIDLINGPGYPILLLPFVGFKLPLLSITLFNALLHYLSVVFLFKSVHIVSHSFKTACIVALCWGLNILAYQEMPCILTECFTLFLISLFSYQIIKIYSTASITYRSIAFAGVTLGLLILTKVIFAYVVCVLFLFTAFFYFLQKRSDKLLKIVCILSISIGTITPYIIYTYSLTGKFFYLSSEGGKVLYWMTSLDAHEYGDWNNNNFTGNCSNDIFCNADYIAKNHASDMERIGRSKSVLEVDSLFKAYAIQHIKANPVKYLKNWYANIGRLLFGIPASYYFQSPTTLIRIYINSILMLAMVYSLIVSLWNWKTLPLEIQILIGFSFVYLGLSSLVSAYPRQLNVMVPAILIWTAYAVKNTLQVRLKI